MKRNDAKELRERYFAMREQIYGEYPEADRFDKLKRNLLKIFLLSNLFLAVGHTISAARLTGKISVAALILIFVMRFVMQMIFLAAGMHDNWKMAFILYVWCFYQAGMTVNTLYQAGIVSWKAFSWAYIDGFSEYPFEISLDIFMWIFVIFVFGVAVFLTLVPKNRRLAEQCAELNAKMRNEAKNIN